MKAFKPEIKIPKESLPWTESWFLDSHCCCWYGCCLHCCCCWKYSCSEPPRDSRCWSLLYGSPSLPQAWWYYILYMRWRYYTCKCKMYKFYTIKYFLLYFRQPWTFQIQKVHFHKCTWENTLLKKELRPIACGIWVRIKRASQCHLLWDQVTRARLQKKHDFVLT